MILYQIVMPLRICPPYSASSTFNLQHPNLQPSTFNIPTFNLQPTNLQPSTFNIPTLKKNSRRNTIHG
ncbi:MAG: hypothetical protein F6K56_40660 [Moorea sp. SIO3G5]|nr:hypothetical protein [Moorena sp. SIO3G5]